VFSKDLGGGEFYQFFGYDLSSGDVTLLTDGKSRNTDPFWSYAGDKWSMGPLAEPATTLIFGRFNLAMPKANYYPKNAVKPRPSGLGI
jgi:hypothetical protein